MARADEIAQGLRSPTGALIGGLVVEDYVKGMDDFKGGSPLPKMTSASYDLGRMRACEAAEQTDDILQKLEKQQAELHEKVRQMLINSRPDLLADYDKRMAEIRAPHP